jgi:hypothetical protein
MLTTFAAFEFGVSSPCVDAPLSDVGSGVSKYTGVEGSTSVEAAGDEREVDILGGWLEEAALNNYSCNSLLYALKYPSTG